jgi:hypothetical protein
MSDDEKPFNPKATIQVGAGDVEVIDDPPESTASVSRREPPPLPPMSQAPSVDARPSAAAPARPPSGTGRLVFVAIVALMLAAAAVGGWFFANALQAPPPAASGAPAPSAASTQTVTLPPVDMR